jgi:hypothetical protein
MYVYVSAYVYVYKTECHVLDCVVFVRNNLKAAEKEDELEPETEGSSKKLIKFPGTRQSTPKDSKVVFVAGATGKVGSRTVR